MKITVLLFASMFLLSCSNNAQTSQKTIENNPELKKIDDSLSTKIAVTKDSITPKTTQVTNTTNQQNQKGTFQQKMDSCTNVMFKNNSVKEADTQITNISTHKQMSKEMKKYWTAYLKYYQSLVSKIKLKDNKNSEKYITQAIDILSDAETSEEYALLASCTSFSIQFANMTELSSISGKVGKHANKALELNPKNIRAYSVLASHNFYTPKMFGGMTQVEEYGLKGLACPTQINTEYYAPTWGKKELYSTLIKYFEVENKQDQAKKYTELSEKEFPKNLK